MTDTATAADVFLEAARLNREDPIRVKSLLVFPDYGQLVMTGDLHGHRRNFEKLKRFCALEHSPARHVILHEVIHEDVPGFQDRDQSHEVWLDAARWKCAHPEQIHFLLSNHELAQVNRNEITKNGRVVTRSFEDSVHAAYGGEGAAVIDAMYEFIRSFPLAGRTANRVMLSHSLPGPREMPTFDPTVLSRDATVEDLRERGAAHALVWGRYHTERALTLLRELLDVDWFICGHQPQESGYDVLHKRMVILASDHNHGTFLPFDLKKPVTIESLVKNIRPFAALQ